MSFKIINIVGKPVQANAHFTVKNYTVSLSTIYDGRPEVAAWRNTRNSKMLFFDSVEEALEYIQSNP